MKIPLLLTGLLLFGPSACEKAKTDATSTAQKPSAQPNNGQNSQNVTVADDKAPASFEVPIISAPASKEAEDAAPADFQIPVIDNTGRTVAGN